MEMWVNELNNYIWAEWIGKVTLIWILVDFVILWIFKPEKIKNEIRFMLGLDLPKKEHPRKDRRGCVR